MFFYSIIVCNEETGMVIFDSKRRNSILEVDGVKFKILFYKINFSILKVINIENIGLSNISRDKFALHVFYLASIPGPSSIYYWDNFANENMSTSN